MIAYIENRKMKIKLLIVVFFIFGAYSSQAQMGGRVIDANDSVIFNLSNAIVTATYIDIPVYIKSTDVINALDFELKFNETILTFDSIISYRSYLLALASFNLSDRYLRFTSSSLTSIEKDTPLVAIRFNLINPCVQVNKTDFFNITTYLNGDPCGKRVTDATSHLPITNFNYSSLCSGTTVSFNNTTTISGATISSLFWDFGNGFTSTLANPITSYSISGNYTVSLIATASTGCKDTMIQLIHVNDSPISNFAYLFNCTIDSVFFTNTSTLLTGGFASWSWTFGDATSSIIQNPSHNYASGGSFITTLTAVSDSGCSHTFIDTIFLNKPTAAFSSTSGCPGALINFIDSSYFSSGTITGWQWYFGDGATSTLQNPTHIYATSGTYNVSLVASSSVSCADSVFQTIFIDSKPIVNYGADVLSGCQPLLVSFSDSSIASIGSNYYWDFGDGFISTLQNPTHTYLSSGTYTVKLIVTTSGGCSDSLISISYINVYSLPVPDFSFADGCSGSITSFNDSSTVSGGSIISWDWYFGDGSLSSLQNPTPVYATSGTYTVNLIVASNQGCSDSVSQLIVIDGAPVVKFGADNLSGCMPLLVDFTDTSITAIGSSYLWKFGDGGTSVIQHPTYTYLLSGVYTVKLIVTTPAGCIDSLTKVAYINVNSTPVANFPAPSGCSGTTLSFTDNSTISSGTITSWDWDFGNGNSSTLQNSSSLYTSSGTYSATLIVISALGCADTLLQTITIDSKPIVKFGGDTLLGCAPLVVNFVDSSITAAGSTYFWNFGDGGISVLQNPTHTYLVSGMYSIKLVVSTPGGCIDSLTKINYVIVQNSPIALYTASPTTALLPNATITFTNQSIGGLTWLWDFGEGTISGLNSPSNTYVDAGAYVVCLTAYSAIGCANTYCSNVEISSSNPVGIPSGFTPNGDNSNDVLFVRGGPFLEIEFRVFNEWGNLIFSSNIQEEGWDGYFRGKIQPVGTYEYTLKGITPDNIKINIYGVVNLIR